MFNVNYIRIFLYILTFVRLSSLFSLIGRRNIQDIFVDCLLKDYIHRLTSSCQLIVKSIP